MKLTIHLQDKTLMLLEIVQTKNAEFGMTKLRNNSCLLVLKFLKIPELYIDENGKSAKLFSLH